MHSMVKLFIEENIDLINAGKFEELFINAYGDGESYYSNSVLIDVIDAFTKAGLPDTRNIRYKLLCNQIKQALKSLQSYRISIDTFLDSRLFRNYYGFTRDEVVDILREEHYNFNIDVGDKIITCDP